MKQNKESSIPDILLERYMLNELTPEDSLRIRSVVLDNESLQKIKTSNNAILTKYPPNLFELSLEQKSEKNKKNSRLYLNAWVVCSIVVLFVVAVNKIPLNSSSLSSVERVKGKTEALSIYKKLPDGYKLLGDWSVVSQGDVIQLGYKVTENLYGSILSVDGNGSVTLHFPENINESTLLVSGSEHFLKTAYELDDAPGYERFFFITSKSPVHVDSIIDAVRKIAKTDSTDRAALELTKNLHQFSCTLKKRALL